MSQTELVCTNQTTMQFSSFTKIDLPYSPWSSALRLKIPGHNTTDQPKKILEGGKKSTDGLETSGLEGNPSEPPGFLLASHVSWTGYCQWFQPRLQIGTDLKTPRKTYSLQPKDRKKGGLTKENLGNAFTTPAKYQRENHILSLEI